MALSFVAANSQYLQCNPIPVAAFPQTFGAWFNPTTVGTRTAMELGSTLSSSHWCGLAQTTSAWLFECSAVGGAGSDAVTSIAPVAGRWDYCLIRWISATNRRISVLTSDGTIAHAQSTVSHSPTLDLMNLGASYSSGPGFYYDGSIAEFMWMAADIQADGAQTDENLLHRLAYQGIYSLPHALPDLISYRSFRSSFSPSPDRPAESGLGRFGRQPWSSIGALPTSCGPHVLLPNSRKGPPAIRGPL